MSHSGAARAGVVNFTKTAAMEWPESCSGECSGSVVLSVASRTTQNRFGILKLCQSKSPLQGLEPKVRLAPQLPIYYLLRRLILLEKRLELMVPHHSIVDFPNSHA